MASARTASLGATREAHRRGGLITPWPAVSFDHLVAEAEPADHARWLQFRQLLLDAVRQLCLTLFIEADRDCWRLRHRCPAGLRETRIGPDDDLPGIMTLVEQHLWRDGAETRHTHGEPRRCRYLTLQLDGQRHVVSLQRLVNPLPCGTGPGGSHCNSASSGSGTQLADDHCISAIDSTGQIWCLTLHPDAPLPATLDELGLHGRQGARLRRLLASPSGWLLVNSAEPVSRTTLLQAMAQSMNAPDRRLLSVDAPVHHVLPRMVAVELPRDHSTAGRRQWQQLLDFEPDVLFLDGHARWLPLSELAHMASEATLVIQACNTATSERAIRSLAAQGFGSAWREHGLLGVLTHRRLPRLCDHCRHPAPVDAPLRNWLHARRDHGRELLDQWLAAADRDRFSVAEGCTHCHGFGVRGTLDLYDLAPRASHDQPARRHATYRRLFDHAVRGDITLAEAARVFDALFDAAPHSTDPGGCR